MSYKPYPLRIISGFLLFMILILLWGCVKRQDNPTILELQIHDNCGGAINLRTDDVFLEYEAATGQTLLGGNDGASEIGVRLPWPPLHGDYQNDMDATVYYDPGNGDQYGSYNNPPGMPGGTVSVTLINMEGNIIKQMRVVFNDVKVVRFNGGISEFKCIRGSFVYDRS